MGTTPPCPQGRRVRKRVHAACSVLVEQAAEQVSSIHGAGTHGERARRALGSDSPGRVSGLAADRRARPLGARASGLRGPLQLPPSPPSARAGTAGSTSRSNRHQRESAPCEPARPARRRAPRVLPTSCMNEFLHPTASSIGSDREGSRRIVRMIKQGRHLDHLAVADLEAAVDPPPPTWWIKRSSTLR
jgi:hypothetical protein